MLCSGCSVLHWVNLIWKMVWRSFEETYLKTSFIRKEVAEASNFTRSNTLPWVSVSNFLNCTNTPVPNRVMYLATVLEILSLFSQRSLSIFPKNVWFADVFRRPKGSLWKRLTIGFKVNKKRDQNCVAPYCHYVRV